MLSYRHLRFAAMLLLACLFIAVVVSPSIAQVSCQQFGNQTYCSNGQTFSRYGNTIYDNRGNSWTQYGNQTYGSQGDTYSRYGNQTYDNHGNSWSQYGNQTYGSNGTVCQTFGNQIHCQ